MGRQIDQGKWLAWRRRFERFEDAGTSVQRFCYREQVSVAAFYQWRRKIAQPLTRPGSGERRGPSGGTDPQRLAFVPVTLTETSGNSAARVEVTLPNGAVVKVFGGDVTMIGAAIRAAGQWIAVPEAEAASC